MDTVSYRLIEPGEEEETFSMVDRGFHAFVREDFSAEGADEFHRAIRDMIFNQPTSHSITVAVSEGGIVGMIDVKENYHISIFFVEPSRMGQGIGRGLLDTALAVCRRNKPDLEEIEVHSSPWAVPVYGKLGFEAAGPEQVANGIRFTRMVKDRLKNQPSVSH
ncbi:MAG: GNAT family N-acetyltransferase [Proteobacteria bacterium]|nr:GNAT family N-acetyltransferase [Pseudomonadota bacterium]